MVDELAARMDKIQAHASKRQCIARAAINGDMAHQLELKLLRNDFAKAAAHGSTRRSTRRSRST
jgi:hypothetical protein